MSRSSARAMKQVEQEDGEASPLLTRTGSMERQGLINRGTVDYKGETQKGNSVVATFFNFAKASIGSGSFALPWGILQAGVLVGSTGMVLLGIASVYTMQMMLEVKRHIESIMPEHADKNLNYTKIGYLAMGTFGKWAVNLAVLGCNLGVCAGYMIFISTNLQWVFNCISVRSHHDVCLNTWEVYAIILPILILLTFLPSFKFLAYTAYLGSLFLVVAMIVVYVYGPQAHIFCAIAGANGHLRYLPENWMGVAQWFGVTAFLFCIHSMVIPLESVMKKPSSMTRVLDVAAMVVVGINLPFAVYGYLLFGDNTQGYIFSNLPGNWFNSIVRLFLSIELTLTFPIVIKPATDVVEEIVKNILMYFKDFRDVQVIGRLYENKDFMWVALRTVMTFTIRGLLVLVSWGVAVGIPRFELCLALVGSLATTILAFVLPPLFHLKLMWSVTNIKKNVFHVLLLLVGIVITVLATSINLYMAIKGGSSGPTCSQFKDICSKPFVDDYAHCYTTIA